MAEKYTISIDMNVLNHLGISLYSNIPAVLSEIVANSWDADASIVKITIAKDENHCEQITIEDNGFGMTVDDINNRFLTVGYQKRIHGQARTPRDRQVIGRKGIGKLSMFSIARTIEVYSSTDGQNTNAFLMDADEIQNVIGKGRNEIYHPQELLSPAIVLKNPGTVIVLKNLKKKMSIATPDFLKRRIARRFNIIGNDFKVYVNDVEVRASDSGYYSKVEYLWTYGDDKKIRTAADEVENIETRSNEIRDENGEVYHVTGWIGTVRKSSDLIESDGNINRISILVRGKVGLEDILGELSNGGLFTKYLIGEISADFFDEDSKSDMATTSRQDFDKSDSRYIALVEFLKSELKHIQNKWTGLRNREGEKKASEYYPQLQSWLNELGMDDRKIASQILGSINQMEVDDKDKRLLFQYGVLAFEKFKINNSLSKLGNVSIDSLQAILEAFSGADEVEAALYYQIVHERLNVLDKFQNIVDEDLKEKVIQQYLFDHLWLLDPSWERAEATERIEQRIYKALDADALGLTDEEKKSRLDLKYRTVAGKTVVIELKRYKRKISSSELSAQVSKYCDALTKVLSETGNASQPFEIICVLGHSLGYDAASEERANKRLAADNARYITYDSIISSTQRIYKEYLDAEKKVRSLVNLMTDIAGDVSN